MELILDDIDWQLLSCQAQNCRLSHSSLAKITKVSPHTVQARLKRLELAGLIRQYALIVDLRSLGFTRHHILLRFDHSATDIHSLCREIAKAPSVEWIPSYIGAFDTQVIVDSHSDLPLHDILADLFSRIPCRISEYSIFTDEEDLEFKHQLPGMSSLNLSNISDDAAFLTESSASSFPAKRKVNPYKISKLEVNILEQLSAEPRMGMSELAERAHCDRVTARRKVLGLLQAGIILNFGAGFDHLALGFHAYHLLFRLQTSAPRETIRQTFLRQPGVFYAGLVRGSYDLSLYIYAKGPSELMALVTKIRKAFGKHITRYDLLLYDTVHHWRHVSDAVLAVLRR